MGEIAKVGEWRSGKGRGEGGQLTWPFMQPPAMMLESVGQNAMQYTSSGASRRT